MIQYGKNYAPYYDLFYSDKDYKAEAAFVNECIKKDYSNNPVSILELACGTGNHSTQLASFGHTILATDISPDMIAVAKSKEKPGLSFRQADMIDFKLEQPVDVAVCLFDSIGYARTNENIICVFDNVNEHLNPGGVFIFEFWNAGAMLRNFSPTRVRRIVGNGMEILRISETTIDYKNQLATVNYSFIESRNGTLVDKFQETHVNRFFLPQEMNLLAELGGLSGLRFYDGFTFDENITEDSWHTVCVAKKGPL